jgi:thiamine-phosphate pyrophosphorylase
MAVVRHDLPMSAHPSATRRAARLLRLTGVYLLTPDAAGDAWDAVLERLDEALAIGVAAVQYRNKQATPHERAAQARAVQTVARRHGALFIVNDDVELAAALDADGVHLGRDDGDLAAARARLPAALLGASCYDDAARAASAAAAGADVLAFGSVYPSATKPGAVRAPIGLLAQARATFPAQRVVAIGGIDGGNIGAVAAAGAHAAAVIGAVFDAPDAARAAAELQRAFATARHAIPSPALNSP